MNQFKLLLATLIVIFLISCSNDAPELVIDEPIGIDVEDGYFMSLVSGEPNSGLALVSEKVMDDSFTSQERAGFIAGYMFLEQGDYNLVQVIEREETMRLGGFRTMITDGGSDCNFNDYTLDSISTSGGSINVGASGFYKVSYDELTSEMVIYKIEEVGIIGSATEIGTGSDTSIPGSVTAVAGFWTASDILLRNGEFNLRFNCRTGLDRRNDPMAGFDVLNGYQMFTSFGGATNALQAGFDTSSITVNLKDEGIYDINVAWNSEEGFTLDAFKTGVAPLIAQDHEWAIYGDATNQQDVNNNDTLDGWEFHIDMSYEGFEIDSNRHTWLLNSIALKEGGLRFRTDDPWNENLGWEDVDLSDSTPDFYKSGNNIQVNIDGDYNIRLSTSDDGISYQADFEKL